MAEQLFDDHLIESHVAFSMIEFQRDPDTAKLPTSVWSRHDFTATNGQLANQTNGNRPNNLLLSEQIDAWVNEGGAGGEPYP